MHHSQWRCPSNIALVKYWGKRDEQLPLNPSLSFVLRDSYTETSVSLVRESSRKVEFSFEGRESPFAARIEKYLARLAQEAGWINKYHFRISSRNSFPHSAGIASSASSFGALALCLAEIDCTFRDCDPADPSFFRRASEWARLGSGSASRSVFPGVSIWGRTQLFEAGSDEHAFPLEQGIHPEFLTLCDAVLLVDSSPKPVSSSAGHELMNHHLFQRSRIAQAHENLNELYLALISGDVEKFIEITESEALSLHAMMMTSRPSVVLIKPDSLELIARIRDFRQRTGVPVCFTIDAGPNIHLLSFEKNRAEVKAFIETELLQFCENRRWLDDRIGRGPEKISQT